MSTMAVLAAALASSSPTMLQVGVPGRWLLRLHQELRSSSGGEEAPGFGSAHASRSGGMIERWKMNRVPEDLVVISFIFGVLFVRGGMYCAPF